MVIIVLVVLLVIIIRSFVLLLLRSIVVIAIVVGGRVAEVLGVLLLQEVFVLLVFDGPSIKYWKIIKE